MSKELQKMSLPELRKLLEDKRKAAQDFRFGVSGAKRKNVKEGATVRRDIARILTAIRMSDTETGDSRQ